MQFIPVKTRIMQPPKDDLVVLLDESLTTIQECDVVLISSKVVAIGEGRCVARDEFDKTAYVKEMAEVIIPRPYWGTDLTITNHVLISSAGVDQSNSNGYYTLLPKDPFASAERIYKYLIDRFGLRECGVIITDSRSQPCRYGAFGYALGFWGIEPLKSHVGKADLFGRTIRVERSNVVDGLAAGAVVVMGETAEQTPIVIARDVPSLTFQTGNLRDNLFCPLKEDTFRVLYEGFVSDEGER
jgi:dihydrofolate synthase / folylpolyglutamate synthase